MCLEAPRSARGLEPCSVGGSTKVGHGGARFIEKADDIAFVGVGGLGDFPQPPGAVEGMEPEGGADGQPGWEEARTINLFGDEGVGGRKVAFSTCPCEFSCGGLDMNFFGIGACGVVVGKGC